MPKLLVAAVFTNTGVAKASGNPYSMPRATVLGDFIDVENSNFQSRGLGFNPVELSVSPAFSDSLHKYFADNFKGLPVSIDLVTSLDREGRNIITGFEKATVSVVPSTSSLKI